ncbi:lanthionine synthetase LanC family protein [Echinicola rosea]|uniref:Lanthionine synthetase C-like protein n=1 Tax=Echinicola rosea TaxID=1807691 RepID=A0ABQ1VAF0_9BACT|nr:lanthionine synthetase LanC family protein [Echinicola rosea]GGF44437.1 hypothetical protein GCM10011339_36160 [Echinicola rosea]
MEKTVLYEALFGIADTISSNSIATNETIHFKTMKPLRPGKYTWSCEDSLYTGNAGILLFFNALYAHSGNNDYLDISKKIGNWLIAKKKEVPGSPSFFLGESGVAYSLLMLYRQSGEAKYLTSGLALLRQSTTVFPRAVTSELFNGLSGTIIVLLSYHSVTGEAWLLERVDIAIRTILEKAHLRKEGICWDRNFDQIHALCGLSHGASGIAYALWTVGEYTGNHNLYWVAQEAVRYENSFYNQGELNWPDFRTPVSDDRIKCQYVNAFLAGNKKVFTKPTFFNAWCNGAVGIGLARLKGYRLTNDPGLLKDAHNAVVKTVKTDVLNDNPFGSYTLCHGGCGNAELLLEYAHMTGDNTYFEQAAQVAEKAIAQQRTLGSFRCGYGGQNGEDISLFMGSAGIGYFLLRLLGGQEVPSVLLPSVNRPEALRIDIKYKALNMSLGDIKKTLLKNAFPKTMENPALCNMVTITGHKDPLGQTIEELKRGLQVSVNEPRRIFNVEMAKAQLDWDNESDVLSYIKSEVVQEQVDKILCAPPNELQESTLALHPETSVKRVGGNHQGHGTNYLMWRLTFNGIIEIELDELRFELCSLFKTPNSAKASFEQFIQSYDLDEPANIQEVYQLFIQNVVTAMKQQLIIPAKVASLFNPSRSIFNRKPSPHK